MEKLIYVALAVLLLGLLAVGCGFWLLHNALNDGNVYKGVLAALLVATGGYFAVVAGAGLAGPR